MYMDIERKGEEVSLEITATGLRFIHLISALPHSSQS
jgi:hypothetical protein